VLCKTTAGPLFVDIFPEWAPVGAARFVSLVDSGALDGQAIWRAHRGFLVQFGIPATHELRRYVSRLPQLSDDPSHRIPFVDGTLSFAGSGADSRSYELFLSLGGQPGLGRAPWETPFGRIAREVSRTTLHSFFTGYGAFGYHTISALAAQPSAARRTERTERTSHASLPTHRTQSLPR